jgi:endoglycosylceramidase
MRKPTIVLALAGLSACTSPQTRGAIRADAGGEDAGARDPLAQGPLHAEPDAVNGGAIVDAEGRTVLLRGVNVNALVDYWKGTDFDTTFPLTDQDIDAMTAIGWNAVRLLLSWSKVEPSPGVVDESYLASVDDAIRRFSERHLYVIVDLHQDAWGATLAARPDEACAAPQEPAFGWDGAPGWATLDGGAPRCTSGLRELSPAVLAAWTAFWNDAAGPEGIGVRTRYTTMLGVLARRYAKEPAVAGFDVMNEPNAFGTDENAALAKLYSEALAAIRAGEHDGGGFSHLVLFEPSALWSAVGSGPPPDFERDRDVVYAPHLYTGGFTNGPITWAAFDVAATEAKGFGGAPILSGEWGSDPDRAAPGGDGYFLDHQAFQDRARISATLWTWRESCGDPHHAADYRAARTPHVWGEFDVDCTTNAVVGTRQDLVDQLTRAYVRAAPGQLFDTRFDPASGGFRASGAAPASGTELVVFYPSSRYAAPSPRTTGLTGVRLLPAPGGNDFVVASSVGGDWTVSIGASVSDGGP